MELRHLTYFVTVAEELHFTRAAARLQMAQPPLSQQIQQLEQELGVALFARTKRQVRLTAEGRVLLPEAKGILARAAKLEELARQAQSGQVGRLDVGFVSSAPYTVIPTIVRAFREHYPQVKLALHELSTEQQILQLGSGALDIGFVRPPLQDPDGRLTIESIWREPLVVALPEHHALRDHPDIPLALLAAEPFILFPRQAAPGLYDLIGRACRQAGFHPQIAQEAGQMPTIISLVSAGLGVALVPASMQHLQRTQVIYRPTRIPWITELAIAYDPESLSSVRTPFLQTIEDLRSKGQFNEYHPPEEDV